MVKKQNLKRRYLRHLGKVGVAALTFAFRATSGSAIDPVCDLTGYRF